jgi:hypothetical protein
VQGDQIIRVNQTDLSSATQVTASLFLITPLAGLM